MKEQSEDCYNMSILVSELNIKSLNFRDFFSHEECYLNQDSRFPGYARDEMSTGGRIKGYEDHKILHRPQYLQPRRDFLAQEFLSNQRPVWHHPHHPLTLTLVECSTRNLP